MKTVLIVLGIVAFRLMFPPFGPFAAKRGLLPKKLQNWLLGEPRA
jgi:hypothetical protein